MGWTYSRRQRGITDADWFANEFAAKDGTPAKFLATATKSRVFYAAWQPREQPYVIAMVCLTNWAPNAADGFNFGYKDMEESMGPNEAQAPARLLDLLTPAEQVYSGTYLEYAQSWRDRCREHAGRVASRPKLFEGAIVTFAQPVKFTNGVSKASLIVDQTRPLRMKDEYGYIYQISRHCLDGATVSSPGK